MPMLFRTSKHFVLLIVNISIFLFPLTGKGEIYKVVNADGTVHLTDAPFKRSIGRSGLNISENSKLIEAREKKYSGIIGDISSKYGIDSKFLSSVIKFESGFNPVAVSEKGAAGLMQLMPETAERFGVGDRFDPRENIEGGTAYISYLMTLYNSNLELVLAAYNAGEKAVDKHNGVPPYVETRNFVRRVLSEYRRDKGEKAFIVKKSDGTILITNRD